MNKIEIEIDKDYLLQLAGDDKELVLAIVNEFETDSDFILCDILELLSVDPIELKAIRAQLHKLKGAATSLGMVSFGNKLTLLETWSEEQWSDLVVIKDLQKHLVLSVGLCKEAIAN